MPTSSTPSEPTSDVAVTTDAVLLRPDQVRRGMRLGPYVVVHATPKSVDVRMQSDRSLGTRPFYGKSDRYTFDGVGYARRGRYLLINGTTHPVSNYDQARAAVMQVDASTPVVVHYSFGDGVTLGGNTEFHEGRLLGVHGKTYGTPDARRSSVVEVPISFERSKRQGRWVVPRTRDKLLGRKAIEDVAEALRTAGVPNVEIVYERPEFFAKAEPEPEPEPPTPLPHQLPTFAQVPDADRLSRDAQWRRLPRHGKDDYRWHEIRLSAPGEPRTIGVATNILGHEVIAWPPDKVFGPIWRLKIDGTRLGPGEATFEALAERFHADVVPRLQPRDASRAVVTSAEIEDARARVRERKARTNELTEVARKAGVEVCPRAVFELEPAPSTHAEVRARAEQYQDIVERYRALHRVELYAAGKLTKPPTDAFTTLYGHALNAELRRDLLHPDNRMQALEWARARYQSWLEIAGNIIAPSEAQKAARVLDTCVRDVESGSRRRRLERATQLREHEQERQRSRATRPPTSTVVAPISVQPRATEPVVVPPFDAQQILASWRAHVAARNSKPPTRNLIPDTACVELDEAVTVCPAIQDKPVGACPPSRAGVNDKSRQMMVCSDEGVYFLGSSDAAVQESTGVALRKRARAAAERPRPEFPAADDFPAQERFLDALVPSRLVIERAKPFELRQVKVTGAHVRTREVSSMIENWATREVPSDATLEPYVGVGTSDFVPLREFVRTLGSNYVPYTGVASPYTIERLRERVDAREDVKGLTANDVQHGEFDRRSLYWLYDPKSHALLGPIDAAGKDAPAKVRAEILARMARPLALPDDLPAGVNLDEWIVLSLILSQQPRFLAFKPATGELFERRGTKGWARREPVPLRTSWAEGAGFFDFAHGATVTMIGGLEKQPGVRFRVAGPWLGVLFPSDLDPRVDFDPPTGGELDLDKLVAELDVYRKLAETHPLDERTKFWAKVGPRRITWAKRYLKQHRTKSTVGKQREEAPAPAKPEAPRKKPAAKKPAAKKLAAKKPTPAPAKPEAPAKKPAAKKPTKSRKPKKPGWRYTTHQDVRHRFRELDGQFVVERNTDDGWVVATASAAKSIHERSESACALAARILPTCGPQRRGGKRRALRPSSAEKDAMRRLLGL